MNQDDIRNLIGGYATGSLTDEERRKLFDAALEDQELFNALQEEQSLKSLLDDPVSREQLRRAVVESLPRPKPRWFAHPWIWAAGASAAVAAALVSALLPSPTPPAAMKTVAVNTAPSAPSPQLQKTAPQPEARVAAPVPARKKALQPAPQHRLQANKDIAVLRVPPAPDAAEQTPPAAAPAEPLRAQQVQLQPPAPVQFAPQQPQPSYVLPQQQSPPRTMAKEETFAAASGAAAASGTAEAGRADKTSARRSRAMTVSPALGVAGDIAYRGGSAVYSFARKNEEGVYVDIPLNTVFQPGETVRLAIFPLAAGPLSVWERNSAHTAMTRIFPAPLASTVDVRARENYVVPIDITVQPGERLRILIGSTATDVVLHTR